MTGIAVVAEGEDDVSTLDFTGNALQYGPGGYELVVGDEPVEAEFVVRLMSDTGLPLSDDVVVATVSACEENIVIVNFVQIADEP